MTKIRIIILTIISTLCACQVIPEDEQLIEMPLNISDEVHPHVLIEYTGFRCVNCPMAAEEAHKLQEMYSDQLIVVAMHPATNPFTQGKYDYTCPAADVYYQWMGGTATTSFPTGNIDMMPYEGDILVDYIQWASCLQERMSDETDIRLFVNAQVDTETREVTIATMAYAGLEMQADLVIWLTEDNITGAQMMPDGTANMNYTHNHVLRAVAGDPWGKTISLNAQSVHETSVLRMPDQCNADNCHIVALILDKEDKHILNATETNIQQL
ncbi:MAG: Omp28 family outer membrane lipoprotein [Paludibacteraceae bacterium]|nr:Omp28 family outer membrane lipoprotein [Paludibacteraceae bacterium]